MIVSMIVFLAFGVWNTGLSLINFGRLFNERTAAEAAAVLPTYVAIAAACFAIFSLLYKIKTLEGNVNSLANKVMACERKIKDLEKSNKNK